jgi:hypothetical protein
MTAKTLSIDGKVITKSLDAQVGKSFKLENFPWGSCPIVAGYDPEYLEFLTVPFWVDPRFKPTQSGETNIRVYLFEIDLNNPPIKVTEINYNLIIK